MPQTIPNPHIVRVNAPSRASSSPYGRRSGSLPPRLTPRLESDSSFGYTPSRVTFGIHNSASPSSTLLDTLASRSNVHSSAAQCSRPAQRRALLIACSYLTTDVGEGRLPNSYKDILTMKKLLLNFGFKEGDITILEEKGDDLSIYPTRANIIKHMKQLVDGSQAGDFLFVHLSGHGDQADAIEDPFEDDGKDELFLPCDYIQLRERDETWYIRDDDFRKILIDPLPKGCKLMGVIDCCNSGTMWDLPYSKNSRTSIYQRVLALARCGIAAIIPLQCFGYSGVFGWKQQETARGPVMDHRFVASEHKTHRDKSQNPVCNHDMLNRSGTIDGTKLYNNALKSISRGVGSQETRPQVKHKPPKDTRVILGDVICIASCADGERGFENDNGGTLVQAFYKVMNGARREKGVLTWGQLDKQITEELMTQHAYGKATYNGEWDDNWKPPVPVFSSSDRLCWNDPCVLPVRTQQREHTSASADYRRYARDMLLLGTPILPGAVDGFDAVFQTYMS